MRAQPSKERASHGVKPLPTHPDARCPRCTGPLAKHYEPALSRFDNMTKVCATCGVEEATFEQMWGHVPDFRFTLIDAIANEKGV